MEQRLSEKDREKRKKIAIIIAIILLLLIIFLFFILYRKQYEITFDSNGGSEVVSIKVNENDKIEKPDNPTREGYIFAGWYYLDELYDFDTPVKSDMTLEAKWETIGDIEVEGISLNLTELTLAPDGTANLVATLFPENAKQVNLVWTSSDESIAIVDSNGNIKALKEGTVTITVSTEDKKYTASCTVTIKQGEVGVEVTTASEANTNNNTNNNGNNSKPNKPSTSSTPSTPSTQNTPSTPTNPSVPSTPSNPSNPTTVNPTGVTISGPTTVEVGNKIQLSATVTPNNATNKSVTWSSSNPSIASVDANGKVTGVSAGTVTITVTTSNGISKTYTITVKAKESTYVLHLTAIPVEGIQGAVYQYRFRITKDGNSFTGYSGFEINGNKYRKTASNSTVAGKHVSTSGNRATITLSSGEVKTLIVQFN